MYMEKQSIFVYYQTKSSENLKFSGEKRLLSIQKYYTIQEIKNNFYFCLIVLRMISKIFVGYVLKSQIITAMVSASLLMYRVIYVFL